MDNIYEDSYNADAEKKNRLGSILQKITAKKEGGTAVGNLIRGKVGSLGGESAPTPTGSVRPPSAPTPKKGLGTWGWVGIGAGVIALGTIIYFATKKK
jgi:hypothetical protein